MTLRGDYTHKGESKECPSGDQPVSFFSFHTRSAINRRCSVTSTDAYDLSGRIQTDLRLNMAGRRVLNRSEQGR